MSMGGYHINSVCVYSICKFSICIKMLKPLEPKRVLLYAKKKGSASLSKNRQVYCEVVST